VKLFIDEWELRPATAAISGSPLAKLGTPHSPDTFLDGGGTALVENGCHDDSGLRVDVKINGALYFSEK
jgi:hypothetical protein